jgi:hypothetical protein
MKYAPPEDKRHTVLGWNTHAESNYVNHCLQKRTQHGFRLAGAAS